MKYASRSAGGVCALAAFLAVGVAHAALLDVTLDLPITNFNSTGTLTYDLDSKTLLVVPTFGGADEGDVEVDALPIAILFKGASLPVFVDGPKKVEACARVDSTGTLLGGVDGVDDLIVEGVIDVDGDGEADYSGTLLTGEVLAFGFLNVGTSTDQFDFLYQVTGGALAPLFSGAFIGVTVLSEDSTFTGSFSESFSGGAKGNIGAVRCLGVSKTGCVILPPPSPADACDGKLTQITLRYTGEGCGASAHDQDSGKVSCDGDAAFADPVHILVTDKDGVLVYADVPSVPLDGQVIAAAANAEEDDFKSETHATIFNADGEVIETIVFHTSCSQSLAPGNQFGSLFVDGMISTDGGEVVFEETIDECITEFLPSSGLACDGKLETLELKYTGGSCGQSNHSQDANKVECEGDAGVNEPVRILVTNKNGDRVWADVEGVPLGGVVLAAAANAGKGHFDADTKVRIYDADANLLQELKFHTSCSQPLELDDQFGAVNVFGMDSTKGGTGSLEVEVEYTYTITNQGPAALTNVSAVDDLYGELPGSPFAVIEPDETVEIVLTAFLTDTTTNVVTVTADDVGVADGVLADCVATATATVTALEPPPQAFNCCEDGNKLRTVTLLYTGADCEATSHSQDPKKVSCDGDPMSDSPVRILATNKKKLDDDKAKVWFDGEVNLDEAFVLDAANAGKDKLKSKTYLYIFDLDDVLLQTIEFHTSCSQPLFEGDQFGSVSIVECTPEGGPIDGQFCVGGAKPRIVTMRYTGDDCGATQHSQNEDKVSCEGDPMSDTPVHIIATDKEELANEDAKVWFDGEVLLDASFDIDAGNADKNKLKSKTFVFILDLDDNLLQSIEFHTSCSQPLNEGDQFGSLVLENVTPE